MTAPVAVTAGVTVLFSGVVALDRVDFALNAGRITGLIGPNGAGKSTLVDVLTGFRRPTTGTVRLAGADVTRSSPENLARRGVGRTFQRARVFAGLTVRENVEVAALGVGASAQDAVERTDRALDAVGLGGRSGDAATALSSGHERMLGLARAWVTRPRVVYLDEPAAGLDEQETAELATAIRRMRDELDATVCIIDHDIEFVMALCARIHVLESGRMIAVGTPAEIAVDQLVIDAYLGGIP